MEHTLTVTTLWLLGGVTAFYFIMNVFDVHNRKRDTDKIIRLEQKLVQLQTDYDRLVEQKAQADSVVRWHNDVCLHLLRRGPD